MRRAIVAIAVAAVVAAVVAAGFVWARQGGVPASQITIGDKASNVSFVTLIGKGTQLYNLAGQKGALLIFVSVKCPVSNAYNERMADLARDYTARGFNVIGVNANRTEPADAVARHAQEHGLNFTIVKDPDNRVADYLGASFTPETYLFDANWVLRYHGRIDDSKQLSAVSSRDLRAALDAVAAGKPAPVAETKAFGCTINRVPKS
jgi:peroxiredoxin